jgi:tRNA nucleotidyltransferase/poly(A) polymerase
VSKERVGIEVKKMLEGPAPSAALELLRTTGLDGVVMGSLADATEDALVHNCRIARALRQLMEMDPQELSMFGVDTTFRMHLYLASMVYHCRGVMVQPKPAKKAIPLAMTVVRDHLKLSTLDGERAVSLIHHDLEIRAMVHQHAQEAVLPIPLGRCIRKIAHEHGIGQHWRACLLFSAAVEMVEAMGDEVECAPTLVKEILSKYEAFIQHAVQLELLDCHAWKYIIDAGLSLIP